MSSIEVKRIVARNCWNLASQFMELSPAAQKVFGAMGGSTFGKPKNMFESLLQKFMKNILKWRLDKLIQEDDPSVRVMTLKAMSVMDHRSRHLGLIATLYASDEIGYYLGREGEKISQEQVSVEVRRYFFELLEVSDYMKDLEKCANHWESVLAIDYTKEFSIDERWDYSSRETKRIRREVPPEEVAARIAKNKAETKAYYRINLEKLFEKKITGWYERRQAEVLQCLDEIFAYLFNRDIDEETLGAALDLLADIAKAKRFPQKWLLQMSQKYAA